MRQNCDYVITFGRTDALQTEALAENFLAFLPLTATLSLLRNYAFRDPEDDTRYALMIDINNHKGLPKYEQRIVQIYATQTPAFMMGTASYWGDELEERLHFLREAAQRRNEAGSDELARLQLG